MRASAFGIAFAGFMAMPAIAHAAPQSASGAAQQAFAQNQAAQQKAAELKRAEAERKAKADAAATANSAAAKRKAGYVTRAEAVQRAKRWVDRNVRYSQTSWHQGYRMDCSGFVSMAWDTKRSYTTRTFSPVAKSIPKSQLKPGDALLTPGHVVLFVKWKDKKAGTFVAYEEANSRVGTRQSVKSVHKAGARAIRFNKIID